MAEETGRRTSGRRTSVWDGGTDSGTVSKRTSGQPTGPELWEMRLSGTLSRETSPGPERQISPGGASGGPKPRRPSLWQEPPGDARLSQSEEKTGKKLSISEELDTIKPRQFRSSMGAEFHTKLQMRATWQERFDAFASLRDGTDKKDQFSKEGGIQEAIKILKEWCSTASGFALLEFVFFALTSLFTGLRKNGDSSASRRRNDAVSDGILNALLRASLEILTHPFERDGYVQHCLFGTMIKLLIDPGDDPDASMRQDVAVSLPGGGIQVACKAAITGYAHHSGVQTAAKLLLDKLGPAIERTNDDQGGA